MDLELEDHNLFNSRIMHIYIGNYPNGYKT